MRATWQKLLIFSISKTPADRRRKKRLQGQTHPRLPTPQPPTHAPPHDKPSLTTGLGGPPDYLHRTHLTEPGGGAAGDTPGRGGDCSAAPAPAASRPPAARLRPHVAGGPGRKDSARRGGGAASGACAEKTYRTCSEQASSWVWNHEGTRLSGGAFGAGGEEPVHCPVKGDLACWGEPVDDGRTCGVDQGREVALPRVPSSAGDG
ncbi:uncharacterized protein LOC142072522 [Caretta caretta]|uniref:uncharacterized protein LOC142072522 n=1 Tax=Caretta caretta TaxID=8467 RepID=UPI003F4B1447